MKVTDEMKSAYPPGTLFERTKNGSADRRTLEKIFDSIIEHAGDVEDTPGKRIVIKLDGGPAVPKNDADWLEKQKKKGIILFPGLPNGSAVNQVPQQCVRRLYQCVFSSQHEFLYFFFQEEDQLFNSFKQRWADALKDVIWDRCSEHDKELTEWDENGRIGKVPRMRFNLTRAEMGPVLGEATKVCFFMFAMFYKCKVDFCDFLLHGSASRFLRHLVPHKSIRHG